MPTLSRETIEKTAAAGAVLVSLALAAFFAFFVFLTFPKGNGIDTTEAIVSWVAVGLLILAVIVAHLVYARILFRHSRSGRLA
jgi:protein-S-isoprenylcysteine O-methyltransferase Ste14